MPGADLPRCPVLGCAHAATDGLASAAVTPSPRSIPSLSSSLPASLSTPTPASARSATASTGGPTQMPAAVHASSPLPHPTTSWSCSRQRYHRQPRPLLHPPPPPLLHLLSLSHVSHLRRPLPVLQLRPRLLALCPTSPTLLSDSFAIVHRSSASASWRKQRLHSTLLCTSPSPSPSSSFLVLTSPPLPHSFPSSTICRLSSVVHTPLCPAALPGRHQRHGCRGRSALAAEQVHHLGHVIFLPSYTASSMVSHCVQIARTPVSDPCVTLE